MKSPSVAQLGLSLVGLYALVQALVLFPSLATWGSVLMQREQAAIAVSVTLLPFVLLVVLGVLLVANPDKVAGWIWRGPNGTGSLRVTDELATLLLAISGILVFAAALPDLVSVTLRYLSTGGEQEPTSHWLAGHLVRVLLGLFLFFRPRAVLDFWRRKQPSRRVGEVEPPNDGAT